LVYCSADYAAPEQRLNCPQKIGPSTDIYAIGAIAYQKITGRRLSQMNLNPRKRYDFTELQQIHDDFPPSFWRKLTVFFKRTLAPSRHSRYASITPSFWQDLNDLIALCQPQQNILQPSFTYHNEHFFGRSQELNAIEASLNNHNVLFLHGMGGIGKSELARQYAWQHSQEYDTIVFLPYAHSLQESIVDDMNLRISHFGQDDEEQEDAYYHRKLIKLREICNDRTLIILDNFDNEDSQIEELLACPARFLITSRHDMSDWNYPQLEIGPLPTLQEQLDLFKSYNDCSYAASEQAAILDLLHYIDGHTMTIELLAKQLRSGQITPTGLAENFRSLAGIAYGGTEEVRHRKDSRLNKGTVLQHLQILFSLSAFTAQEQQVLRALSLLGGTHMEQKAFASWCPASAETLAALAHRGWLKIDDHAKLYLHQIILDLAYEELPPTTQNCGSMLRHLQQELLPGFKTSFEKRLYRRICNIVFARITGTTTPLMRLYWLYNQRLHKNEELLKHCIAWYAQQVPCPMLALGACKSLLAQYYQQQPDPEHWLMAATLYKEIVAACSLISPVNRIVVSRFLWQLGRDCLYHISLDMEMKETDDARTFAATTETCWLHALALLENSLQPTEQERELTKKILKDLEDFYDPYNYTLGMLSDIVGDELKKSACRERRIALDEVRENVIDLDSLYHYTESADSFLAAGDYVQAIVYYNKARQQNECREYILPNLAEAYEQTGQLDQAITTYEQLLELDKAHGPTVPISSDYRHLAYLEELRQNQEKAQAYAKQGLAAAREEAQRDSRPYTWLQFGLSLLQNGADAENASHCYSELIDLCRSHGRELLQEKDALPIWVQYCRYLASEQAWDEYQAALMNAAHSWIDAHLPVNRQEFGPVDAFFAEALLSMRVHRPDFLGQYLQLLGKLHLKEGDFLIDGTDILEISLTEYQEAYGLASSQQDDTSLTLMAITARLAEVYDALADHDTARKYRCRCDYYALAQAQTEGRQDGDLPEIWQEAAQNYQNCYKYSDADRCLAALLKQWQPERSSEKACRTYVEILIQGARNGQDQQDRIKAAAYLQRLSRFLRELLLDNRPAWGVMSWFRTYYKSCADLALAVARTDDARSYYLWELWLWTVAEETYPSIATVLKFAGASAVTKIKEIHQIIKSSDIRLDRDAVLETTKKLAALSENMADQEFHQYCRLLQAYFEEHIFSFPTQLKP
jgi:tetratricopeptide (TPR) repeat protein